MIFFKNHLSITFGYPLKFFSEGQNFISKPNVEYFTSVYIGFESKVFDIQIFKNFYHTFFATVGNIVPNDESKHTKKTQLCANKQMEIFC